MKYNIKSTGPIDKIGFARSYAGKVMRDQIDGKRSIFLNNNITLNSQPYANPQWQQIDIYDGQKSKIFGLYAKRSIISKHRYIVWLWPQEIIDFFSLDFDDYAALYGIVDDYDKCLARMRW